MKTNRFQFLFLCISFSLLIISCTQDDIFEDENFQIIEKQEKIQKNSLSAEAVDFKNSFLLLRKEKVTRDTEFTMSDSEIKNLRNKSLAVLNSYGFKEKEFEKFMEEGDPRLILLSAMFVGIMENNQIEPTTLVKTRSEGGIGETCLDVAQVARCIAVALKDTFTIQGLTGCVTKTVAINVLKSLLKKVPWVSVAWALDTFADCMGWYDSIFH